MSKRRIICLLLAVICMFALVFPARAEGETQTADVNINNTNFPDDTFRSYISTNFDTNKDNVLSGDEIEKVYTIDVRVTGKNSEYRNITSLEGIKYFTALNTLKCGGDWYQSGGTGTSDEKTYSYYGNSLTEIDVSGCKSLQTLNCEGNSITSLKLSGCTNLRTLNCSYNSLESLDLSTNKSLNELICYNNKLKKLDVSANTALQTLSCRCNQLTELDVSANTALTKLSCGTNQLTELDVSANKNLVYLICNKNQLTELDVSNNTALAELWCAGNMLTTMDVSKNTGLTELSCGYNRLTNIDISGTSITSNLHASGNSRSFEKNSNNTFNLSSLTGFDASKASIVSGGTLNGNLLTITGEPDKDGYITVTYNYDAGKDETVMFTLKFPEKSKNIEVNTIGVDESDYSVEGQVVTVTCAQPCKVGYLAGGKYMAIKASAVEGGYSFEAPDDITSVIIVVKGDADGDGDVDSVDVTRLKAAFLEKVALTPEQEFAGDLDGDADVDTGDVTRLKAVYLEKTAMVW